MRRRQVSKLLAMGANSDSADEAYEDDTEPLDELPDSQMDADGQPEGSQTGPPPLDVTRCSSSGEDDPLPSAARDTPAKRQARTLAAELEGVLENSAKSKDQQESWPSMPAPRRKSEEEIFAAIRALQPPGDDELDVTFENDGPLGIVFRSTLPSADGRAFVKALRTDSAAAKHAQLSEAWKGAAGHRLVLTAVNGNAIDDPHGMGQFRAGLEAVKTAGRPIVLRLQRLPVASTEPSAEPEPQPPPELEPELEPEPESQTNMEDVGIKVNAGVRGAAATRKTRNALLGGLRSGTLEGAVSKMEDDLYLEELRAKDPAAWLAERARRVEEKMIDDGEVDPDAFLKLKPPPDLTFIEEIRWTRAQKKKAADAAAKRRGEVKYVDDGVDWSCKVCTETNVSSAPRCRVCGRNRGHELKPQIIEQAKRAMAGVFDGDNAGGTKSHIANVFSNMYERKQLRHMPKKAETEQTDEPRPSPLMILMQSERALEDRLLDIDRSFNEPRKPPSAKEIRRRMSKPVRVRGYNDSLFESFSCDDVGLSNARSRRRTTPDVTLPPAQTISGGDKSDEKKETAVKEEIRRSPPRSMMVEASTLTDIEDSDI